MVIFDKKSYLIAPSLICLDMLNISSQINELEKNDVKLLHIDILDGHFSPSMPLGFELVKQLKPNTSLLFDCHIMVNEPEYFIEELIDIGVEQITFQYETASHVDALINKIHNAGIRAGIALKPQTPVSVLEYVIEKCDNVLLMLINPGYASSKKETQVPYAERKICDLQNLINKYNKNTLIEVDGRISLQNIENYIKYGVNLFVGGTTCINRQNIKESIENINDAMAKGMKYVL